MDPKREEKREAVSLRDTSERHLPPRRGVVRAIGSVLLPNFYTGLEGGKKEGRSMYELRFETLIWMIARRRALTSTPL